MIFQSTIYCLWKERKARRHNTSWMPALNLSDYRKSVRNKKHFLHYHGLQKFESAAGLKTQVKQALDLRTKNKFKSDELER